MKPEILVIAGPTASGKTALGIEMALRLNGEIISADSMQIYKGMDIATAKPTAEEMSRVQHHLIGFLDRSENFSVADYVKLASEKADDIISRGKVPVVVGGTGLYISSFVNNIQFPDIKNDEKVRERLRREASEFGNELLLERLIQARGFRDVIVTLSDKNCTVVVADDNLEAQEVAQILSVVTNETSYTANDVIVCQY